LSGHNSFRVLLTLELAVMLPAAALILHNFYQLRSIGREKVIEAAIHRDFQEMLAISEKKINEKLYGIIDGLKDQYPFREGEPASEKERKLDQILANNPWLAHVFLFDGSLVLRSPNQRMTEKYFREEHESMSMMYQGWFGMEGKNLAQSIQKKTRPMVCYTTPLKRTEGPGFITTVVFTIPQTTMNRAVLCGASIEPRYLQETFFPESLEELVAQKATEDRGNKLALVVYPSDDEGGDIDAPLAASSGWTKGNPEVTRKLDEVFHGLSLGIKFPGTTVHALSEVWMHRSLLMLGLLTLMMSGGLYLAYRGVSREMALARLKSDFVSNVSHELRTPLALIRLYAETLELGRIKTTEKMEEYYRIIRKESERLTALINNILDFSRIEAGAKEYDFRPTDVAELVRNTLDSYRYQIEQQGFTYEERIDSEHSVGAC
jgi:hypothetical protein